MSAELAQQHPAGFVQAGGDDAVDGRHIVDPHPGVAGRADAGGVVDVFQAVGDAVHRAAIGARLQFRIGALRVLQRTFGGDQDERVEHRIARGDRMQRRLGERLAGGDAGAQLASRLRDRNRAAHCAGSILARRKTLAISAVCGRGAWSSAIWARNSA